MLSTAYYRPHTNDGEGNVSVCSQGDTPWHLVSGPLPGGDTLDHLEKKK